MKKEANVKGHVRRTLKGKSFIVKQYKKKINFKDKKEQSEKFKKIALGTVLGLGVAGAGLTAGKYRKLITDPENRALIVNYFKNIRAKKVKSFPKISVKDSLKTSPFTYTDYRKIPPNIQKQYRDNLDKLGNSLKNGELDDLVDPSGNAVEGFLSNKNRIGLTMSGRNTNRATQLTSMEGFNQSISRRIGTDVKGIDVGYTWKETANGRKYIQQDYKRMYEQGFDETSVLAATKMYKTIKLNGLQDESGIPKIYTLFGHSSGGKQATEAAHILKSAGIPEDNLRVITYGGESTPGVESFKKSLHILDSADDLARTDPIYTDNILDPKINWPQKYPEVVGTPQKGHYQSALIKETVNDVKEFTNPPKPIPQKKPSVPKSIKQQQKLEKFREDLNKLQNNQKLPEEKKQQLIKDVQDRIQKLENEINGNEFRKCNYLISNFSIRKRCKPNEIYKFRINKKKNKK